MPARSFPRWRSDQPMKPIDVKRGAAALHLNRIQVLARPFRLRSDQRSNESQNKIKEGEHG